MVQVGPIFAAFLAKRSAAVLPLVPGIAVPQCFSDATSEHLATRRAAGLFDFSFMYCVEITGAGSGDFLRAVQTREVDTLSCGRIAYTLLLHDDGSVLIDATIWRLEDDRYWLFTGRRADANYIADAARDHDVALNQRSRQQAVIAVQGPASPAIIERALNAPGVRTLKYFSFTKLVFAGADCWLARIGYSGERGYELVIADAAAPQLWNALLAAGKDDGILECGFDAIDSLRIEAGHILFTHELASATTPAELGMTRLVDFTRPAFRGTASVRAQRWRPPARRLVGLLPLHHARFEPGVRATEKCGASIMTSKSWSPLLERELALGFVPPDHAYPGTRVILASGEPAQVARLPFYDPARVLPRRVP